MDIQFHYFGYPTRKILISILENAILFTTYVLTLIVMKYDFQNASLSKKQISMTQKFQQICDKTINLQETNIDVNDEH